MSLRILDTAGVEMRPGQTVMDNRGERAIIVMATRARTPGKSGKVVVRWPDVDGEREYYDMVFNLRVVDTEEKYVG